MEKCLGGDQNYRQSREKFFAQQSSFLGESVKTEITLLQKKQNTKLLIYRIYIINNSIFRVKFISFITSKISSNTCPVNAKFQSLILFVADGKMSGGDQKCRLLWGKLFRCAMFFFRRKCEKKSHLCRKNKLLNC